MDNLYQQVEDALIAQIHKYEPDLTVTDSSVMGDPPAYPYISIDIYGDGEETTTDIENAPINLHVQIKCISDNKNEAKTTGLWLRKLLFLRQVHWDLIHQHIVAVNVATIPSVEQYLDVDWQFSSGADYTLQVQDDFEDNSQPGIMQHVSPKFNAK